MASELLCWLPTPAATLTPRLPLPPFTEPLRVAVLVTGLAQPVGVSTWNETVFSIAYSLASLKLFEMLSEDSEAFSPDFSKAEACAFSHADSFAFS